MCRDTPIYAARQRCGRYSAIAVPIVLLPFNVRVPKAICRAAGLRQPERARMTYIGRLVAARKLAYGW